MSHRKLTAEHNKISRLRHIKNAFSSDLYRIDDFPEVKKDIEVQLGFMGLMIATPSKHDSQIDAAPPPGYFEIQTHNRSVHPHKDDVSSALFCIYPVKNKVSVYDIYQTSTEIHGSLMGDKVCASLVVGRAVAFNPRSTHSLIYYGQETTFMLFSVKKSKALKYQNEKT